MKKTLYIFILLSLSFLGSCANKENNELIIEKKEVFSETSTGGGYGDPISQNNIRN